MGWSWWVTWGMLGVIRMLGGEGWRVLRGTVEMLGALEVLLGGGDAGGCVMCVGCGGHCEMLGGKGG